jgi:hypothetical protein
MSRRVPEPLPLRPSFPTLAALLCLTVMVGCDDGTAGLDTEPDPDCVTTVDADIESATTWGDACRTIEVLSSIFVDAPLTVLPGTTVLADQGVHIGVRADGSLNAVATDTAEIVFEGMVPDPGFWSGISIASVDEANHLQRVAILHTGATGGRLFHGNVDAALVVLGPAQQSRGKVLLTDVLIFHGSGIGLKVVEGGSIEGSTDLRFDNIASYPVEIGFPDICMLDPSFMLLDTDSRPIHVKSGRLTRECTLPRLGWNSATWGEPLLIEDGAEVWEGGFLTIEGGNLVYFEQDAILWVRNGGRLALKGTVGAETDRVELVGQEWAPGYWGGIVYETFSPDNVIETTTIRHAGARGHLGRRAAISIMGQSTSPGMLEVTGSRFTHIPGIGILVYEGGMLTEEDNHFSDVETPISDNNP